MAPVQSPQIKRMYYIKYLHDVMFSYVFQDRKQLQTAAINRIAEDNQTILNAISATFVFDGLWYPEIVRSQPLEILKKPIESYIQMQELLQVVDFDNQDTQVGIRTLLGNILMLSKHKEDLNRLLPSDLFLAISPIDRETFDVEDPLSTDAIDTFMEQNKINFGYLRRLVITRLLLARN